MYGEVRGYGATLGVGQDLVTATSVAKTDWIRFTMPDHVNGDEKWQLQIKERMQLYAGQVVLSCMNHEMPMCSVYRLNCIVSYFLSLLKWTRKQKDYNLNAKRCRTAVFLLITMHETYDLC